MNRWLPIATAPTDGTTVRVRTNSIEGLPAFETWTSYHPDAGWCVDELREVIEWLPGRREKQRDYPGRWQSETLRRLDNLGYDGMIFGPGVNWWPMKDGAKVGGPFTSKAEFDRWLDEQERDVR